MCIAIALIFCIGSVQGEAVKVATYNIEYFSKMFDQQEIPWNDRDKTEFYRDREDIYEVASVINLTQFDADIICIQEGPTQEMLELFNKEFLDGKYSFV